MVTFKFVIISYLFVSMLFFPIKYFFIVIILKPIGLTRGQNYLFLIIYLFLLDSYAAYNIILSRLLNYPYPYNGPDIYT